MEQAGTVGELRRAGYQVAPVREEMRRNLLAKLAAGERLLTGIVGYDDSVIPEIENAILAGHHIVFLGERGQGKSRIMRGLLDLLDPVVPAIAGCEVNDDPFAPSAAGAGSGWPRKATRCRSSGSRVTAATARSSRPPTSRWRT
jgi:magnesium chelatase subunit I